MIEQSTRAPAGSFYNIKYNIGRKMANIFDKPSFAAIHAKNSVCPWYHYSVIICPCDSS